jgi:hypothetical protein
MTFRAGRSSCYLRGASRQQFGNADVERGGDALQVIKVDRRGAAQPRRHPLIVDAQLAGKRGLPDSPPCQEYPDLLSHAL